jgi:uncharacterized protein YcnI
MKQLVFLFSLLFSILFSTSSAFAHVVVKPSEAAPSSYQTFVVAVPNEKDIATIKVRLVIPDGVESVKPTQKIGWQANLKKEGEIVKEIEWASGVIPKDFRDEFSFSAKTPAKEGDLVWKAYQTYQDGTEVPWDQVTNEKHSEKSDHKNSGEKKENPASVTKVSEEAGGESEEEHEKEISTINTQLMALWGIVILSLVVGIAGFTIKNQSKNS